MKNIILLFAITFSLLVAETQKTENLLWVFPLKTDSTGQASIEQYFPPKLGKSIQLTSFHTSENAKVTIKIRNTTIWSGTTVKEAKQTISTPILFGDFQFSVRIESFTNTDIRIMFFEKSIFPNLRATKSAFSWQFDVHTNEVGHGTTKEYFPPKLGRMVNFVAFTSSVDGNIKIKLDDQILWDGRVTKNDIVAISTPFLFGNFTIHIEIFTSENAVAKIRLLEGLAHFSPWKFNIKTDDTGQGTFANYYPPKLGNDKLVAIRSNRNAYVKIKFRNQVIFDGEMKKDTSYKIDPIWLFGDFHLSITVQGQANHQHQIQFELGSIFPVE